MKNLLVLAIIILPAVFPAHARNVKIDEIDRLDLAISEKAKYDAKKHARIDSIKRIMQDSEASVADSINCLTQLGEEYTLFKADSAMIYYNDAISLAEKNGDTTKSLYIRLRKIRPEMIAGFYAEAHDEFNRIANKQLNDSLLPYFYECGYRLYSFGLNSSKEGTPYYDHYYRQTNDYRQKWIALLPENSAKRRLYEAEQAFWDGKMTAAKLIAGELLSELPEHSNEYAIAAAILANVLKTEGKTEESMKYYALSAISDLQGSVKENQSIYELSTSLYDMGDIDRAYKYIFASIEDAAFCNAQVRVYNASRFLPVIEAAHREEQIKHEHILWAYFAIVSLLLVGLAFTVLLLFKQVRKLSIARKKLRDANMTKDEYMGQFLELCSIYMKRLDSFTKMVNRKLSSGQVEDLMKMTKSARFSEEQHKGFYHEFDIAFLKIYTTFVSDMNSLLRPEERIAIETPGMLTTELRIYALIRLGMEDSSKIAEFLRYSVNTIYTYRNKMKNKAINRATFEEDVMKIGIID